MRWPPAECAKQQPCAKHKDELEECAHRVQVWDEADEEERKKLGSKEDCVEECRFRCLLRSPPAS